MTASSTHRSTRDPSSWWRSATIYQVYIRSFADGDGDGTGDVAGLRSRLGHLAELGVDAVWINPWYSSPLNDGGYDVADYRAIDHRFGTLDDAEQFIADAHRHGIRVILDLVPNHTSSQHPWFQAALADPASPMRERYHFDEGRGPDGEAPPNNWRSVFGGPAWTRTPDGQWYLHLFDSSQPDLNWHHPAVRAEFCDVLRFWLDRDADGFRVDVAHGLMKHPDKPDLDTESAIAHVVGTEEHPHWDRDELHDVVREWRRVIDEYPGTILVAEAWVHPTRLPLYLRPDEYHQSFNFSFLETTWDARAFRTVISESLDAVAEVGAAGTWVLSNHDVVRHATRYGLGDPGRWRAWLREPTPPPPDDQLGLRRARAAALLLLSLPGAAYLYQGEELGLPEVWDLADEVRDDPVWFRTEGRDRGRDGCRVPIPWTADGPSFGFGADGAWLPQPSGFGALSVASQHGNPESTLELYRNAIDLRRQHLIDDETLEWLDSPDDALVYRRGALICAVNMGSTPIELPSGEIVLASGPVSDGLLPADTAVWMTP